MSVYPSGALSDWAQMGCEKGLSSIIMAGSPARIGFKGSNRQLLGTNPICIGVPGKPFHFISDTATSEITHGALMLAQQNNSSLKEGAAVNGDGEIELDPNKVNPAKGEGALLTVGASHKTFALSMAIELLTSLAGGIPGSKKVTEHGVFGIFFKADVHNGISETLKIWNESSVKIPGWNSQAIFKENHENNVVKIDNKTYEKILTLLEE